MIELITAVTLRYGDNKDHRTNDYQNIINDNDDYSNNDKSNGNSYSNRMSHGGDNCDDNNVSQ